MAAMGIIYHFLFHLYSIIYTNRGKYNPLPVLENVVNTGNVDRACLEFLETAAVAIFAVKSKACPGLLNTFFAIFFYTLSPFLPKFFKKT